MTAAQTAGVQAAMLSEDEVLTLLRHEFGDRWSIAVCDGTWEAAPRAKTTPDLTLRATEGAYLALAIIRAELRSGVHVLHL